MLGGLKKMIKGWLDIQEAPYTTININENLNFDTNRIKNEIWMRGDPNELEQLYKVAFTNDAMFWGSVPKIKMRKIHLGLPHIIVETLTSIVIRDMNDIKLNVRQDEFDKISEDNNFKDIVEEAVLKALYLGDGAFKITFDKSISDYPLVEFYASSDVDLKYTRGRFKEAIFKTKYTYNKRNYMLYETYGYGYIKNKLVRLPEEKEVPLNTILETSNIKDYKFSGYDEDNEGNQIARGQFCMAIPFKIFKSTKWKNRGRSVFDSKEGAFDSIDEAFSQWMDAVRASRATKYIPENLLPRDPRTGKILKPNDFDNRFIDVKPDGGEHANNEIKLIQPVIPSENYMQSYMTALDACLQGLISPSTLGIDVKKLDNAEAQREKEKATLYTRNKIIEALQKSIPLVINNIMKAYDTYNNKSISDDIEVTVEFGEYANPSFEATVETVSKAKQGGIMSIEASIDELYGDSKDKDWKMKEIQRLREEQGIAEMEEPTIENVKLDSIKPSSTTNLNGAQITSMMGIIKSVKAGELSRANAINIITSTLGVSKEVAETFIDEQQLTGGDLDDRTN
jgi:hypothetical protein